MTKSSIIQPFFLFLYSKIELKAEKWSLKNKTAAQKPSIIF